MTSRSPLPRRSAAVVVVLLSALVAYIVLAASHAGAPTPEATGGTAATPSPAPATTSPSTTPAPPVLPGPPRLPTLGISVRTAEDLERFTAVTGTVPDVVDVFQDWADDATLDRDLADAVAAAGARLSITWQPWDSAVAGTDQPGYSLATIIAGDHDAHIDRFAASVAAHGRPVTIRLMHEMNGSWYPWGDGVNGNQPGEFVLAWQHVHDRFTALGVTVDWLWAPNALFTGSPPLADLYPGDAAVDAVGVSNYNWGERVRDGFATHWRTFGSLFDESITALRALTSEPLWIAETGSSNEGGSKADWLAGVLTELQGRPEIVGLVWFDHLDDRHGVDWRIETEPATAMAWRLGFEARRTAED